MMKFETAAKKALKSGIPAGWTKADVVFAALQGRKVTLSDGSIITVGSVAQTGLGLQVVGRTAKGLVKTDSAKIF